MRRAQVWQLRETLREHPSAPVRMQHCGRTRYEKEAVLQRGEGDAGWWAGVVRCRSRICPVCWIARRAKQAHEIAQVVEARETETGAVSCLLTLTVRHGANDGVELAREVRSCWRALLQRRRWRTWREQYGIEFIAAEEVTHGKHGWHPHIHSLLLPSRSLPDPIVDGDRLFEEWCALVVKRLGERFAPSLEHGVDIRPCHVDDYLTKLGIEVADPYAVKGKAPLALLSDGELELYVKLQLSRTRARDITFSRGLRTIRDTLPDADQPADLLSVGGTEWSRLVRKGPAAMLDVMEAGTDPETARAAVDYWLTRAVSVD